MEKGKSRRVFLSFLGLGNPEIGYRESSYIDKDKNKISKNVKYVQNAVVEIEENNFDEKYIFCTEEVLKKRFNELEKEKNWNSYMRLFSIYKLVPVLYYYFIVKLL